MANRFATLVMMMGAAAAPMALYAQDSSTVREAATAYRNLDFPAALKAAKRAVGERQSQANLVTAYEIMAFTYAALDSTRQAVKAFRELIFLDPDREPNVERVSPKITSLYASALGQVLVVRGLRVDSASFIGGQGGVQIQFSVSRPARANTRLVGEGLDVAIDSQLVAGVGGFRWSALTARGDPLPAGHYEMMVTANEGPSNFTSHIAIEVRHSPVDTVPQLSILPGYSTLAETEVPPRDWKPVGATFLFAGLTTGAAFALSNNDLGSGWRGPTIGISISALAVGIIMTLKKPDPRPVQANIRYNQLLAEQLAQRNADIAKQNAARRRQTLLTVVAAAPPSGPGP
jgi:hypothetical protein